MFLIPLLWMHRESWCSEDQAGKTHSNDERQTNCASSSHNGSLLPPPRQTQDLRPPRHLLQDLRAEVTVGAGVAVETDELRQSAMTLGALSLPARATTSSLMHATASCPSAFAIAAVAPAPSSARGPLSFDRRSTVCVAGHFGESGLVSWMRAFGHAVSGPEGRLSRSDGGEFGVGWARTWLRRVVLARARRLSLRAAALRSAARRRRATLDSEGRRGRSNSVMTEAARGQRARRREARDRDLVHARSAAHGRTIDECWPCSRSCAPRSPTLSAGRRWPAAPSIGPRPGSRCFVIRAGGYARAGAGDLANGRREAVTAQRTSGEAAPAVGREPGRRALGEEPDVWNVYGCIRGRRRDSVLGHSTRPSSSLWRHRHRAGRDRGPRR